VGFRQGHFRNRTPRGTASAFGERRSIHAYLPAGPRERLLLSVTASHLIFLPWALATVHPWSQFVSLGLALISAGIAFLPVRPPDPAEGPSAARRLLRSPFAWLSAAVLVVIFVQALNPAWRLTRDHQSWWLEPLPHLAWLPRSVEAPFDQSNPWRSLVIYGAVGLQAAAIGGGFKCRQSFHFLGAVLVGNAALLSLLGLLQDLTGTTRIFWQYAPSNDSFVSSFIYRNHAGAYFNLMVALATGLGWWHFRHARRTHAKSSPAALLGVIAAGAGALVGFSASRMSIVNLLAFLGLTALGIAARRLRRRRHVSPRADLVVLCLMLAGAGGVTTLCLQVEKVRVRFLHLVEDPQASAQDRIIAGRASVAMLLESWPSGWGAGCFRHGFPMYAAQHPEIYLSRPNVQRYWEYAHNDPLQFAIEFGLFGVLPLALLAALVLARLWRVRFWRSVVSSSLVLAVGLLALHSTVDFVLQNPAILHTAAFLLIAAIRWIELEPNAAPPRSGSGV